MGLFGNSVVAPHVYYGTASVIEKHKWLTECEDLSVYSEAELTIKLEQTVKEFTQDAEKYLLDVKTAKDKKKAAAQGYILAGLGLYIVGSLLAVASPIAGIIVLVMSIISSVIGIVKSVGVENDMSKLKDLKLQAIRIKNKVKDKKDAERLERLIEMIDHEVDSYYRDQPNKNVNYNYNF